MAAGSLQEEKRDDTSVLFYDLGNLKVLETGEDGIVYGFGRDGEKIRSLRIPGLFTHSRADSRSLSWPEGICPVWSMTLGQRRFCPWIREQRSTI